jgi:hypothetical protein
VVAPSPWLLAFREELTGGMAKRLGGRNVRGMFFEVHAGENSLWTIARWPTGGGVAFRTAYAPHGEYTVTHCVEEEDHLECRIATAIGEYRVRIEYPTDQRSALRWTTHQRPSADLVFPFWPRDVYPLDAGGDPLETRGVVHATQRGPKGALLYLALTRPESGSLLYMQNLTSLNSYFEATHTCPSERVSGMWPELGFSLPSTESQALKKDEEIAVADALVCFSETIPQDEGEVARLFLDLYAEIYLALPRTEPLHRHWPRRVVHTIRDLTHSPECSTRVGEHRYLQAYVGSDDRPPESMVQLAVLVPMIEYEKWKATPIPLIADLRRNLATFYDPKLRTMVRWLPSLPYPKQREMDSWYLYHTYLNLSRLALQGEEEARKLFLDSIDYGIRVAQHFEYRWPVFYEPETLEVLRAESKPGAGGEQDVGALYAHVMLQAWELTGDRFYVEEAERAAGKLQGLGFALGYQFNNTAFGAGALLRLWKETGKELYLRLSIVCMAGIVHNIWLWECSYGNARHYSMFMGLPPLHDGHYLALFEELEVLAAFHDYLKIDEDAVQPSLRLLLAEYCKYLINRAWLHYPDALPIDILATESESGHINSELSIPLEDIGDGWRRAGEVGQEVYGAAAPFVFATRHCMRVPGTEFLVHCNYPTTDLTIERTGGRKSGQGRRVSFRVLGDPRINCRVRVVCEGEQTLPDARLTMITDGGRKSISGKCTEEGYLEYEVPGNASVVVEWDHPDGDGDNDARNNKKIRSPKVADQDRAGGNADGKQEKQQGSHRRSA